MPISIYYPLPVLAMVFDFQLGSEDFKRLLGKVFYVTIKLNIFTLRLRNR